MKQHHLFGTATALGYLVIASIATAACGDDKNGSPPSGVHAYAAAFCEQTATCAEAGSDESIYALMARAAPDACASAVARIVLPDVEQYLADGLVKYNSAKATACLAAAGTCQADSQVPVACEAIFEGLVPVGGACDNDIVCAGDARCDNDDFDYKCPGVCKARVAVGEACADWDDCSSLAGAAECDYETRKCVASAPVVHETAAVGEPCGWFGSPEGTRLVGCAAGYVCASVDEESVCAAVLPKGASCAAGSVCELGTFCAPKEGGATCESITIANAAGTTCNQTDPTKPAVFCNALSGLFCGVGAKCTTTDGTLGAGCDGEVLPCNEGLYCHDETKVCAARKAVDAACEDDAECLTENCGSDQTCKALVCE